MKRKMFFLLSMTMVCASSAAPVRSSLSTREIATTAAQTIPTAKDYIQDGLIAMWDGIENAGDGVHDSNATNWIDLTGNEIVIPHGTVVFDENCFSGNGSTYFSSDSTAIGDCIQAGNFTIEIGCRPKGTRRTNGGILGIGIGNSGIRQFWVWEWGAAKNVFIDGFQIRNASWTIPTTYNSPATPHIYQVSANNTQGTQYCDGDVIVSRSIGNPTSASNGYYIGRIGTYYCTGSDIYFVRIYNRGLTASEIRHNYKIDKKRFGL